MRPGPPVLEAMSLLLNQWQLRKKKIREKTNHFQSEVLGEQCDTMVWGKQRLRKESGDFTQSHDRQVHTDQHLRAPEKPHGIHQDEWPLFQG